MEFLRAGKTEATANTYVEEEIATPVSRSENLAMLIWQVAFQMDRPDLEDAQSNNMGVHLASESKSALVTIDSNDIIHTVRWFVEAGNVQGSLSEYAYDSMTGAVVWDFAPPVLYAKGEMFAQVLGEGNANAKSAHVLVGYTLERVNAELFIAALVE